MRPSNCLDAHDAAGARGYQQILVLRGFDRRGASAGGGSPAWPNFRSVRCSDGDAVKMEHPNLRVERRKHYVIIVIDRIAAQNAVRVRTAPPFFISSGSASEGGARPTDDLRADDDAGTNFPQPQRRITVTSCHHPNRCCVQQTPTLVPSCCCSGPSRQRTLRLTRVFFPPACRLRAGAGTQAFTAGVDLSAARQVFKNPEEDTDSDIVHQMDQCTMPIIGAINGWAINAGFEMALACDLLFAAPSAVFMDTHCKFGLMPSWGLSQVCHPCTLSVESCVWRVLAASKRWQVP